MFDLDRFIDDCKVAVKDSDSHMAVKEVMRASFDDPAAVLNGVGAPTRAGLNRLYVSDELTILNLVWGPMMTLLPHNHNMWALIGIYTGREDNIFWRRLPDAADGRVEAAGAKDLHAGDVAPLGRDVIHSVTNPIGKLTGALHVYGGNFFEEPRSEWDPESLTEQALDVERTIRLFEESNARLAAAE